MVFQQLAPSSYARDLTEAAATTLVSCENVHREKGESATEALLWAIDNGGLFTFEQALNLLVDQAVNIHEDQRVDLTAADPTSYVNWLPTGADEEDRLRSLIDTGPVVLGDCLPIGADEEDRIFSLLSLGPS